MFALVMIPLRLSETVPLTRHSQTDMGILGLDTLARILTQEPPQNVPTISGKSTSNGLRRNAKALTTIDRVTGTDTYRWA